MLRKRIANGRSERSLKIFGISMVRNEVDVVGLTVLHHLALGLEKIFVLDNGSTDGTDKLLRNLAKEDERVKWSRDEAPFDQAVLTTELAREAYRHGADWVLPFDADEFWWTSDKRRFRKVLADSEAGSLGVRLVNFVQARSQHESTPEALLTMTRRVLEPFPRGALFDDLFRTHQISFLQGEGARKRLFRPTAEVEVKRGNHKVLNARAGPAKCEQIVRLHAPLRSRAHLQSRAERYHRLEEAGISASGDKSTYWANIIEEGLLDQEWAANSYEGEHLNVYGKRYRVVPDFRLHDAVKPLAPRVSQINSRLPCG
jgi:hypothetical protein